MSNAPSKREIYKGVPLGVRNQIDIMHGGLFPAYTVIEHYRGKYPDYTVLETAGIPSRRWGRVQTVGDGTYHARVYSNCYTLRDYSLTVPHAIKVGTEEEALQFAKDWVVEAEKD